MRENRNIYSPKVMERYRTFSLVKEGLLTLSEASKRIGLSYRHTHRLFHYLLKAGMDPEILLYKRNHHSWNRLSSEEREKVIKVFDSYPEINNCHLSLVYEETLGKTLFPSTI